MRALFFVQYYAACRDALFLCRLSSQPLNFFCGGLGVQVEISFLGDSLESKVAVDCFSRLVSHEPWSPGLLLFLGYPLDV